MASHIHDYKVSYSKYLELRKERIGQQMAAYENQQKMIEKTEDFINKFRYKPTKSNQGSKEGHRSTDVCSLCTKRSV